MYLSKLHILGFKSFAQKTILDFSDGITCVIGPNGSGKSNIVDAIRWVLGEQRVSSLRSDKMENVIFNGTKARKPMGMSEVSMTIQNNKKILDTEYDEVVISRRLYRSGESQYLINQTPVRLRDVVDLFTDTGMGANSYSVIELKMVESILSDNKAERRQLFEEAAGIVKYKTRRRSALRKLEQTENDLDRVNDIIIEVEKTVNSLSRQVSKARRYIEYTDNLKKLEIDLATFRYHRFMDRLKPLERELKAASREKEESHHQITLEEALLEDYNQQTIRYEQSLQQLNGSLYEKDNAIRNLNQEDAIAEAKIEEMKKNRERYLQEIEAFEQKAAHLGEDSSTHEQELGELRAERDKLESSFAEIAGRRDEELSVMNREKAEIDALNKRFRDEMQKLAQKKDELQQKEYRLAFDQEKIQELNDAIGGHSDDSESLTRQIEQGQHEKEEIGKELDELKNNLTNLQSESTELEQKLAAARHNHNAIVSETERVRSRQKFFQNIISNYEGLAKSTQFVMNRRAQYKGLFGPLVEIIDTPDHYAGLVETLLGDQLNYLVVENVDAAMNLLNDVRRSEQGRVTCIPLDRVEGIAPPRPDGTPPAQLNLLINHIRCEERFRHLLNILLGDVAIVDSLEEAARLADKNQGLRLVTAGGEMFNFNREITGGSEAEKKETALITRKNKLKELEKQLAELEKKSKDAEADIADISRAIEVNRMRREETGDKLDEQRGFYHEADKKLSQLNYELNTRQKQQEAASSQIERLNQQITELEKDIGALKSQVSEDQQRVNELERETISRSNAFEKQSDAFQALSEEYQDIQLQLSSARNRVINRENDIKRIEESINELNASIERRKTEIENTAGNVEQLREAIEDRKGKRQSIWEERDALDKQKQELEKEFQEVKDKRHELETQIKEYRRRHDSSLEKSKKLEIEINQHTYQAENIRSHIQKEHNSDVDALIPNENLDENETEENIESLKTKIKNLGAVNPLAVSEYDKESERLNFLTSQRDDLMKAEQSLLETIDKINKTARKQFSETFEAIRVNFERVFNSFFPNGAGTIRMENTHDPLEAEIDIEVTAKGRQLQTLSLLSGGEKTLTAISLLFAIYLVKPSPFCILDEVDAPLDDVNIGRFTDALNQFSDNTQFIVVTHNKRTMEAAETMYGITMEEEGISKVVSVRMN